MRLAQAAASGTMQGSYLTLNTSHADGRGVLLAMSGGVDSAVSALALHDAGYRVVGMTMKNYCYGDAAVPERSCCSIDAIDDARAVCQRVGIRHMVVSTEEMFGREVYDNFLSEYARGHTPNPCVRCNSIVRFNTLVEWAGRMGFDYVATGHYARVFRADDGQHFVARASHPAKDQAYFLSAVEPSVLRRVIFPLGDRDKPDVRADARGAGLAPAEKPDSQEVCFVGTKSLRDYLDGRVPLSPGPIQNTHGEVIGTHEGAAAYTVGQRRGLGVSAARPQYVVAVDTGRNTVVLGGEEDLLRRELTCRLAWMADGITATRETLCAQIRSRHPAEPIDTLEVENGVARVVFRNAQRAVAPGQTVAFFDGDVVVGSGVIEVAPA